MIKMLCGGFLVSCVAGNAPQMAQRAQGEMVGMPKQRLLACAGYPDHQAARYGKEYFTYRRRANGAIAPTATISDGASSSTGVALGIELETPVVGGGGGGCVATIVLSDGVVEQVAYPANGWLSECAPIVQNCVTPASGGQ